MDETPPRFKLNAIAAGLLILIAALVYFPVLSQEVANHDEIEWIRSVEPPSLHTAKLILTWDSSKFFKIGYYAPLTALSIMTDLRIGDMVGNRDAVLKATNLGLHILNTLLVFTLVRVMGFGPWISFAVAAIFCVHPLQVGSVAWLAERKNLLMSASFLTALLCYYGYRKRGGLHWFGGILVFYLLSLAAKPSAVALGPCIFIADWFLIDRRITLRSVLRVGPMIVIGLLWTTAAVATEGSGLAAPPLFERLLLVPYKIGFMLSKFMVPINLVHIYPPIPADAAFFLQWGAALAFIAAAGIVLALHWSSPIWIVLWGIAFYLLNLLPSLGIVPFTGMKEFYVADHYQYLSLIAASLLVVLGVDHLVRRIVAQHASYQRGVNEMTIDETGLMGCGQVTGTEAGAIHQGTSGGVGFPAGHETTTQRRLHVNPLALWIERGFLCAAILALGLLSHEHVQIWKNAESLWTQVISKNPGSLTAHYNYGHYLDEHGRFREAVIQYELAIAINDQVYKPYNNLGLIMMKFGKLAAAETYFLKCAELNPMFGEPHLSLAKIYFFQEKYELALEHCQRAADLGAACNPEELEKAALDKSKQQGR